MRWISVTSIALRALGAAVGGFAGYWLFRGILHEGLYALVIPGALLGLGAGLGALRPSRNEGILCGLAALALGVYIEWSFFPFKADESLSYFLTHMHQLKMLTIFMIVVGGLIGFSWGKEAHNPLRGRFSSRSLIPAREVQGDEARGE